MTSTTIFRFFSSAALVLAACGGVDDDAATPDADTPAACTPVAGTPAERVTTTSGVLVGAQDGATWAFRGVPFAAPPVGDLRFEPPAPVACASSELDATVLGPRCPQLEDGAYLGDEDCLQLNIWAPSAAAAPRPVMLWIHGGGNAVGSAADPLYDGRALAEAGDVVVVTTNYRLGQLGFLAHPSLPVGSGNLGILDQIAALTWVRDNIAAFGGDPSNVTIFGESAGGRNVCTLLAASGADALFHRAIIQSGACKFLPSLADAQSTAADVAAAAGCTSDVASCLRALTAEELINTLPGDPGALGSSPYQPTIDGVVLEEQPSAALSAGRHHAVPLIVGANADETASAAPPVATENAYQTLVRAQFGTTLGDQVLAQYPASRFPTPRAAYVRVTTDARFLCPSREIARAADTGQSQPVYRYFFQYDDPSPFGAVHGLDVPFVWGTFSAVDTPNGPYQPTATDLAVSASMQSAWTSFARDGAPTTDPSWPTWDATDPTLVIDAETSTMSGIRTDDCDFWKPIYDAL
jgi:para-nitrobenzyl esterase